MEEEEDGAGGFGEGFIAPGRRVEEAGHRARAVGGREDVDGRAGEEQSAEVPDAVEVGQLVPVLSQWKSKGAGAFYFVYANQKYTSPKVQAFIQTALDVASLGHA